MSRSLAVAVGGLALAFAMPAIGADPAALFPTGELMAMTSADLEALAAGTPLVISHATASGGGLAAHTIGTDPTGVVAIRSRAEASAAIGGSPVTLTGGGQLSTGGMGDITMTSGSGIAGLQLASGIGNIQQSSVSFAFVMTGAPAF